METKDLIGLALLGVATPVAIVICCFSVRARDLAFFCLTAGTVLLDRMDINFLSRYWYRGTTRGIEFSLLDLLAIGLLASEVLLPRPGNKRWLWAGSLWLMVLYFCYACFSVAISDPKIYGIFELSKIVRGMIVFIAAALYIRGERELCLMVAGLGCAVLYEGALSVKQHFLGGIYRATGSLDHPNSLSCYVCTAAPVLLAAATAAIPKYLKWFCIACIPVAMVTMIFTVSRAGIPVFGLVMLGTAVWCISWELTAKKVIAVAAGCVLMAGFVFQSWDGLKERFEQTSLKDEYASDHVESRGYFLKQAKIIVDDQPMGVGLNNWSYWVSKKYGVFLGYRYEDYDDMDYAPSKEVLPSFHYAAPAHNLGALTLGELGYIGLGCFLLLWIRWFQMAGGFLLHRGGDVMHRIGIGLFFGLCGMFLQNLVEWVYRQSQIYFMFHIVLGALASLYAMRRSQRRRRVRQEVVEEIQEPAILERT